MNLLMLDQEHQLGKHSWEHLGQRVSLPTQGREQTQEFVEPCLLNPFDWCSDANAPGGLLFWKVVKGAENLWWTPVRHGLFGVFIIGGPRERENVGQIPSTKLHIS